MKQTKKDALLIPWKVKTYIKKENVIIGHAL